MRTWLPILFVVSACITRQFNGLWEWAESSHLVAKSDALYQFWDDLGDNLSVVIVAVAVWLSAGPRIWKMAGLFIALAAAADTCGLWLNPDHYDSWKWELACAVFSSGVLVALRYCFPRRFVNSAPPPQKPYRSTRIGFTGRGKD